MNSPAKSQPRRRTAGIHANNRAAHANQALQTLQAAIEAYARDAHPDAGEYAVLTIHTGQGATGYETLPMRFPKPARGVRAARGRQPTPTAA